MGKILLLAFGWVIRHFFLFFFILVLLILSTSIAENFQDLREIPQFFEASVDVDAFDESVIDLMNEIKITEGQLRKAEEIRCYLPTCSLAKEYKIAKYGRKLSILESAVKFKRSDGICNECKVQINMVEYFLSEFSANHCTKLMKQFTSPCKDIIENLEKRQLNKDNICSLCWSVINSDTFEEVLKKEHERYTSQICKSSDVKLICIFSGEKYKYFLKDSLIILLLIVFFPITLGLFLYYIIAPIATKFYSITLLPDTNSDVRVIKESNYQHSLEIKSDEELFVKSGLIKGSSENAIFKSRWILDYRMPLTCLTSGTYGLTQARSDENFHVSVYGGESDNYEKSLVIEVNDGAAIVLQPSALVGLIQPKDRPIKITRHWRLKASNFLALRFRFLVFHGPCKLLIQSNRGIAMDSVAALTRINQADTIGFTANLTCKIQKSETFYAYQTGKKDIFDDCFSGDGFVLHEVKPIGKGHSLFVGRSLEGLISAALKAFGI